MLIPPEIRDRFPRPSFGRLRAALNRPGPCPRVLIDTDTANEIDDQFALAWALLSPDRLTLEAVTAEPFSFAHHRPDLIRAEDALRRGGPAGDGPAAAWAARLIAQGRSARDIRFVGPDEGAALSHDEILRVFDKCGVPPDGRVFHGAPRYLERLDAPVASPAAQAIVDRARGGEGTLYILAMGALTNVASALLMAPDIAERIVVVWTAGFPSWAPFGNRTALNLVQDPLASALLFESGVPLVYLPGYHVGAQLRLSLPEMDRFVRPHGRIGAYLHHLYTANPLHEMFAITGTETKTWVIWDIICVAWLLDPGYVAVTESAAPVLGDDLHWQHPKGRHPMLEAYDLNRDAIFEDFYATLARGAAA